MSFFKDLWNKAQEELKELAEDARSAEDKLEEYFHRGVLHSKIEALEERFLTQVSALKQSARLKLEADVKKARDAIDNEIAQLKQQVKDLTKKD